MSENLKTHTIKNFITSEGVLYKTLNMSYQIFGPEINSVPIVLVNHALTGNSNVCGNESSWWNEIVGPNKVVNTKNYTVIAIDILGNGFNGTTLSNFNDFSAADVAKLNYLILESLNITYLHAIIGGSVGGGIAWEMAVLTPNFSKYIIPIASNWRATDWLIGHCHVQNQILNESNRPLELARQHAMLIYRTPLSFALKFKNDDEKVRDWLNYHGKALNKRFQLQAYQMVNHLLASVDITKAFGTFYHAVLNVKSTIIQVGINSDLFFSADENIKTQSSLNNIGVQNKYHEIKSPHGHDAFLIEHDQLTNILKPYFNN